MQPEREPQSHELTGKAIITFGGDVPPVYLSALCSCGCGQTASICDRTARKSGLRFGQPRRYVRGHQCRLTGPIIAVDPVSNCWVWLRTRVAGGYGTLRHHGRVVYAHRHAWEAANGAIPAGLELHHLCWQRACVNPAHLVAITKSDHAKLHAAHRNAEGEKANAGRNRLPPLRRVLHAEPL